MAFDLPRVIDAARRAVKPLWSALVALCCCTGAARAEEPPGVASRGLVSLIDDVHVPAYRPGIVTSIAVRAGDHVAKGAILAQIDVEQAELEAAAARAEWEAAVAKADSDVDARNAKATYSVAKAEHQSGVEANTKVAGAVSQTDLERRRLAADQAFLKLEASEHEQRVRSMESKAYGAREGLARLNVRQRLAKSPIEGEVAELLVQAGEWIESGKPLLRVVGLSRLRVETFVRVADRLPKELLAQKAHIRVAFASGVYESFSGQVTLVSPIVQPGGDYRVWIEVENRRDGDQWLLRPGLEAEVTIGQ
jgi:multidrug resistance efflux pump